MWGYGLTDRVSLGGVIEHAFPPSFPNSHIINSSNFGMGFYADWHFPLDSNESYFRPGVSFNQYNLDIERAVLSHTEDGKGSSQLDGIGASLEGGQNLIFSNKVSLGWHAGLRYSHILRNAYQEKNTVSFPVKHKKIHYDNAAGYMGADVYVSILPSLMWSSGIEIAKTLKDNALTYNAKIDAIAEFNTTADLTQTRSTLKTGMTYTLHKNFSLSVLTSLNSTNVGNENWATTFSLTGQF